MSDREENRMPQVISRSPDVISQFRRMLPARCATAQAIDHHQPWDQIALTAVDDGYIESANDFDFFIEVCVNRHP